MASEGKVTRVGSGPARRNPARNSLVAGSDKSGKARVTDRVGRVSRKGSLGPGGALTNTTPGAPS